MKKSDSSSDYSIKIYRKNKKSESKRKRATFANIGRAIVKKLWINELLSQY